MEASTDHRRVESLPCTAYTSVRAVYRTSVLTVKVVVTETGRRTPESRAVYHLHASIVIMLLGRACPGGPLVTRQLCKAKIAT